MKPSFAVLSLAALVLSTALLQGQSARQCGERVGASW
jgi:hypothetical protein